MSLNLVNRGKAVPEEINVIIEIPAHSQPIKYEVDKDSGALFVDRFIATYMRYPCNYGYLPHTLSEDGDPVDVLVVTPMPVNHGCVIAVRPVGMLKMQDESGVDMKILAVPVAKLTPQYDHIHDIEDVPELLKEQIVHFFEHYKDLEPGKWVKLEGWLPKSDAQAEILQGIERFDSSPNPPAF